MTDRPYTDTELRDRIRRVLCESDDKGYLWGTDMLEPDEYGEQADAVLAILPGPADQAAEWYAAADHLDELPLSGVEGGIRSALTAELRRMADEAQVGAPLTESVQYQVVGDWGTESADDADEEQSAAAPRRGDAFEAWLKAQRDAAADYPEAYQVADGLLDLYRLHADTDTPLGDHVCEGAAVGACECLEPDSTPAP